MRRFIIVFVGLAQIGFGQSTTSDSPVGTWTMIEHLVPDTFDHKTNDWAYQNIYKNEFTNTMIFFEDGAFKQQVGDSVALGTWKLSSNGKKLTIIAGGHKWQKKQKKKIDFSLPLMKGECLKLEYSKYFLGINEGDSKFVRVKK